MLKTSTLAIALVAAATLFLPFPPGQEARSQEEKSGEIPWLGKQWEYKVLRIDDSRPAEAGRRASSRDGGAEETLNELGQQGWELITIRIDAAAARTAPIFYFKRPVDQSR